MNAIPKLRDLGPDLLHLGTVRRLHTLVLPFVWCSAYFLFATLGWWPLAVLATMGLSFVTFGSTSHDLVHRNLGLSKGLNDILLSVTELLALRSGHAYQAAHLHHHARFPHEDDVESLGSRGSFWDAILEGFIFQPRIYLWALRHAPERRGWIVVEGIVCLAIVALAFTGPVMAVYVGLMIAGSWTIPLITSYLPHDPHGKDELHQTRLFRGSLVRWLSWDHLYHLEHHLYPAVPHKNWPELARRLDPFFAAKGLV